MKHDSIKYFDRIIYLFIASLYRDRYLNLEPTSSSVSLAGLRHSPSDLHTSQTPSGDHARVDRALRDEFVAAGRENGQNVCRSLMVQLVMHFAASVDLLTLALIVKVVGFGLSIVSHSW
jgi:hypothetical protein